MTISSSLLIVNQCFSPDIDATGQMMADLAEDFVKKGIKTTVVTGRNQTSSPKNENINGIIVFRVNVLRLNKKILFYRYLNYLSLFPLVLIKVLFLPRHDSIFMVSSPPFMFLLGWLLKTIKRTKLIFNLQDLYPDVAINLGLIKNSLLKKMAKRMVLRYYKSADKIICVGEKMRDLLRERGVPAEKISVIHNWADGSLLYPIEKTKNSFIEHYGWHDKFIIQYSGNFGMVHEIDTILHAAKTLANYHNIHFVFIGDGVQSEKIRRFILDNNLSNISMLPFQPRENLNSSLNACDISLVSIKNGFEGAIVPSKIYGILAVGKPVFAICHPDSEVVQIIKEYSCGVSVMPGDVKSFIDYILELYKNNDHRQLMAENSRRCFINKYNRTMQTQIYFNEIQRIWNELPYKAIRDQYDFDLSICLVNYNAGEFTVNCIKSIIQKINDISFEIIIIDNNSLDDSIDIISREFHSIKIIKNSKNKGFAHASNLAIQLAAGKYIMLLNNDTILLNNAPSNMIKALEDDTQIGVVTCKVFDANGISIQRNCRSFPITPFFTMFGRNSLMSRLFSKNPIARKSILSDWDYNSKRNVEWISGAVMLIRRELFSDIGLLDENFFMYWEDTDYCKRAINAGWEIWYMPDGEIIHYTGQGGGKRSLKTQLYSIIQMHRSAYYYFLKHYYKSIYHPMAIFTFVGMIILIFFKTIYESIKYLLASFFKKFNPAMLS